jgi:hypothetical protein
MWLEELSKIKFRKALANYYREDIAEASLKIEIVANEEMNEKARWLRKLQSCFGFNLLVQGSPCPCSVLKVDVRWQKGYHYKLVSFF